MSLGTVAFRAVRDYINVTRNAFNSVGRSTSLPEAYKASHSKRERFQTMSEVAKDVFCLSGTDVNVGILREGSDLTMIDGGWPGDVEAIEEALRSIGHKPEDVRAILLTHAHVDHLGAVDAFHRRFGTPVYSDPVEVHHAAREYLEQAGTDEVEQGPMPQTMEWWERVQKVGAEQDIKITDVQPVGDGPMDIPGRPVPVATHGHTSGHSAFLVPSVGVIATGDALVTGHACSTKQGPQPCPWFFNHSRSEALEALDLLEGVDADVILPGHGDPMNMKLADAVKAARTFAADTGFDNH